MYKNFKNYLFLIVDPSKIQQYLSLTIPKEWQDKRQERDGTDYHITIVNPQDDKTNMTNEDFPENMDYDVIGFKKTNDVAFLVINYPAGDKYRKQLGLQEHNFHITLGFVQNDIYTIDKSINCLEKKDFLNIGFYKNKTTIEKQLKNISCLYKHYPDDIEILKEYINCLTLTKQYDDAINYSYNLLYVDCNSGVYSILKIKEKADRLDSKVITEMWKYLLETQEITDDKTVDYILQMFNKYDNSDFYYYQKNNQYLRMKKPRNFSQVHQYIYGSAIFNENCLDFLKSIDIKAVFNLMEKKEGRLDKSVIQYFDKKYYQFEIPDRSIISFDQMNNILDVIDEEILKNNKIIIHCMGGKGRTNMVIACYLMKKCGQQLDKILLNLKNTRDVIFSKEQDIFMHQFQEKILEISKN